ncbi:hypothetical protein [Bdellovibrio sp. NC01]|uniref:hypothetical protein n=1 Tax=Bdellovibrio sp. NC01 TaxID=2220073 RepID=UPI00115BD411|nr:hypothetical protein [Bdellovibrio sp. NC01]QDK39040.1 hypothetical protein DOE51_16325 [Bdellovibrio sp. NC01]
MDKISGILPASPRMKLAEIATAQPARPGAPAEGRVEGRNSLGDRVILSKELEKLRATGELPGGPENAPTYKNTAQNSKLKTIDDLNKKFFSNPKDLARDDSSITRSEEVLNNVEDTEPIIAPRFQAENRGLPMSRGETAL